jgi:glycosyltransferase involved in cell wall biosynthesis
MPAHNEEGIIERALDALERLKCPEVEVLVGLDGCTDGTREIVQRYDFVRFVELKERCGKPAVLRRLMDMAEGDIIVVHDADWRFVCDGERMKMLIEQFDDPQLGGVVLPPHDIPFPEMREGIGSNCFAGSGLGVLLLWEYLLRTQTKRVDDKMYVDKSKIAYPFTVDVFRRGIIPHVTTAADDFERFLFLARTDYSILILNDRNSPYFEITDRRLSFRGHFRQRVKGHIARAQIEEKLGFKPGLDFYLPFSLYCLKNIKRLGVKDFALVLAWALTILLAFFWAKIILRRGVPDAKKAWRYRVR